MLCSVLLPTRKRVPKLLRAVRSVFATCVNPSNVEVVLRVHSDDTATLAAIPQLVTFGNVRVAIGPFVEYGVLGECFDEASALARGKWLMQFNDDCEFQGEKWDVQVAQFDPATTDFMLQPEINRLSTNDHRNDLACPFMWYPARVWTDYFNRTMHNPVDCAVWIWAKNKSHFLKGVKIWHDRDQVDCERIAVS